PSAERAERAAALARRPVLVNHVQLFAAPYRELKRQLGLRGETPRVVVSGGGALGPFRAGWSAAWDWLPHDAALLLDLFGGFPAEVAALSGPERERPENWAVRLLWNDGRCGWIHSGRLLPSSRRALTVATQRSV